MNLPRFQDNDMKYIIWIQTAFLGDIILSTGAFKLAKEKFPDVKTILITTQIGKIALTDFPYIDHTIVIDKKQGLKGIKTVTQKVKMIVGAEKSVVLQLHRSFRSSVLAQLLRLPVITYRESQLSYLADDLIDRVSLLHESQRCALLLEKVGVHREDILNVKLKLFPNLKVNENLDWVKRILKLQKKIIAISVGSKWGTKRWLPDYFSQLIEKIIKLDQYDIVLIGGIDEKELAEIVLAKLSSSENILNLVGKTNLDELRFIYPKVTILISNDSSPIHYASAFNIPTLAIFGATVSSMGFGPFADFSLVAELDQIPCRPCSDHGPSTCPKMHFDCMKKLTPEIVFEYFLKIESELRDK